jgi:hypothetical protein
MKKMLFMAVLVIGGGSFLKSHMVVTPNGQIFISGWAVPVPPAVQNSPIMGLATMLAGITTSQTGVPDPRYGTAQPVRPAMPNVTSANGTYNANTPAANGLGGAPGGAPGGASDQLSAVARALR